MDDDVDLVVGCNLRDGASQGELEGGAGGQIGSWNAVHSVKKKDVKDGSPAPPFRTLRSFQWAVR